MMDLPADLPGPKKYYVDNASGRIGTVYPGWESNDDQSTPIPEGVALGQQWDSIIHTSADKVERLKVPGGWLYRCKDITGRYTMAFAPYVD